MEKKYRLEPFNLERAKAGEPVCTRNGRDARIICWDRDFRYPIVALVTYDNSESILEYRLGGNYVDDNKKHALDLMMKVEAKEHHIYAEIAGRMIPFDEVKAEGFIDLESLDYLVIKTHDGSFLKVWKKDSPEQEWEDAQEAASRIGAGWRCPTRRECLDIYDARFEGLNDAMKEIGGDALAERYWTSEVDSDPMCTHNAVYFYSPAGNLNVYVKCARFRVRPVCTAV